jgi:pimeloyl-ACP methyl ester carboxylesterase
MGGRNASYCAAKHPARVAGLVLADYSPENAPAGSKRVTDVVAGQPDVFGSVDEAMRHFGVPKDSPKRARFEAYLRPVPGGVQVKRDLHFRDQFRRAKETGERPKQGVDMWQVLGEPRVPDPVVRGAQSDMFAPETVAKVKAANARISLVEVDGGHNVAADNPQGFLAAIRPFIAGLEGLA